jgi:hypothetical protein
LVVRQGRGANRFDAPEDTNIADVVDSEIVRKIQAGRVIVAEGYDLGLIAVEYRGAAAATCCCDLATVAVISRVAESVEASMSPATTAMTATASTKALPRRASAGVYIVTSCVRYCCCCYCQRLPTGVPSASRS